MSLSRSPLPRSAPFERAEPREQALRIVDYTRFPRSAPDLPRVGFTRDLSPSGMCIGVDEAEAPGSMLRATLRNLDGTLARSATWRVVWCNPAFEGRYWLGLQLVVAAPPPPQLD